MIDCCLGVGWICVWSSLCIEIIYINSFHQLMVRKSTRPVVHNWDFSFVLAAFSIVRTRGCCYWNLLARGLGCLGCCQTSCSAQDSPLPPRRIIYCSTSIVQLLKNPVMNTEPVVPPVVSTLKMGLESPWTYCILSSHYSSGGLSSKLTVNWEEVFWLSV